jgi:biotin transport system substrate-specific component
MRSIAQVATGISTISISRRTALIMAGVAGFALATAAASYVRVPLPFSPVPVTMQTMVVLLSGAMLGPVAGAASQALYLSLGAAGLPVFTTGATLGLTGYVVGFVVAAALIGFVTRRTSRDLPVVASMVAGSAAIYLLGATWLAMVTGMSATEALTVGVLPFLAGDAIKLAAAFGAWRTGRLVWARATSGRGN